MIIPCFNEENNILMTIKKVKSVLKNYRKCEILIIDDGSTEESSFAITPITSAIGGGILLILVAMLVAMLIRKGEDKPKKQSLDSELLFELAEKPQLLPLEDGPDSSMIGEIKDDFEWIEYPVGSGVWYFKDKDTLQWVKH